MTVDALMGLGYTISTSDGGAHSFGAPWYGSMAGKLAPGVRVVAVADDPATGGYWLAKSDGGGGVQCGLREAVLATIHEAADSLGFEPHLHYEAPAGAAVADSLAPTVAAVLREALCGAARRSHANRVEVTVEIRGGGLCLSVADNGKALESVAASSAVADLEHRAEHLGGTFDFDTPPGGGTRLTWQAPLPEPVPGSSHRGPQGAEPAPA